jgi:hypothetical protein
MNRIVLLAVGLCAAILPAISAAAEDAREFTLGSLTIAGPWARPTDKMAQTGAIYFVLKNAGAGADRLVSVSTEVAGAAQLHHVVHVDGMMSMRRVPAIDVPAGGETALKPGGYHVMLLDLKSQLTPGREFPLELTFEKAGKVTVQVRVAHPPAGAGEMKMDGHGADAMKMDGHGDGGMKH